MWCRVPSPLVVVWETPLNVTSKVPGAPVHAIRRGFEILRSSGYLRRFQREPPRRRCRALDGGVRRGDSDEGIDGVVNRRRHA
jgi:hypothetical protein